MCGACAALWHVDVAAILLHQEARGEALAGESR
jgi:hypothetical protein